MYLDCSCQTVTFKEWKQLMKGARPLNYKWLKRRIKKHLPTVYNDLALDYYNPYEEKCAVTKTHYILVHSDIEYFIHK